ncbi:MAG: hypothetical protein IH989_07195 [Planctomycetes bacterium]|nr:hypothetical protein [Planctomycetota bacterium]
MRRFIPIVLLLAATGCRETEPPPTLFQDLGTDGSPLLPTFPVWKTAAIADGQADWHAFREPAGEPELGDDGGSTSGGEAPGIAKAEIEAEIREVIAEFNEVVRTGAADDILEYFVAEQADALEPIVETTFATQDVIQQLQGAFDAKLPDAADRSESATNAILAELSLELKGETLNVKSDTEVDVGVKGGVISQTYRFVIVDDEWYIEVPEAERFAELGPALDRGLQFYREMLESVRSGAGPAEERLKEMESAIAAAQATPAAETEDGATPDDAPPTDKVGLPTDDGTGD